MGCAKGDEGNGATAKGGAVSSEGRCDPAAGCTAQSSISSVAPSPYAGRSRFAGPSPCASGRDREGPSSVFQRKMRPRSGMRAPQRITNAVAVPDAARSPLRGAPRATLWAPWRCAPWHRSPSYVRRRTPYDHPDFNSNALSEDLFSGSLGSDRRPPNGTALNITSSAVLSLAK
jgi:hypothetical protein